LLTSKYLKMLLFGRGNRMKLLIVAAALMTISASAWADCGPWAPNTTARCSTPLGGWGVSWNRQCDADSPVCAKHIRNQPPTSVTPECAETAVCLDAGLSPAGCEQWVENTGIDEKQGCHGQNLAYWTRQNSCVTLGKNVPTHFCSASIPSDDTTPLPASSAYTQDSFDPDNFDVLHALFSRN
jgi:hypothetical protein